MALKSLTTTGFANLDLIESMYVKYQTDPWSLDKAWREVFSAFEEDLKYKKNQEHHPAKGGVALSVEMGSEEQRGEIPSNLRIYHLIQSYRTYGHLMAKNNPIALGPAVVPRQLQLQSLGFKKDELNLTFPANGFLTNKAAPLREIIDTLEEIYCGNIGVEYIGIQDPEMERWLQEHIEPGRFRVVLTIEQKKMILQHLNKSELFESFLHTKYVGQKRFSLEGGETLIPILASVIEKGADLGLESFVIGMAHRGRLNVLANILNKSYSHIFSEFQEGYIPHSFEGSGDVKYHKGFSSKLTTAHAHKINVSLAPNPSHLEAVYPVVEGQVRAKQVLYDDNQKSKAAAVIIHGDASISGQGVVYETMQMFDLEGYATGGTIHIVINNQIGFTTLPQDARSTRYCTDIARTFNAPVFHVNAEDPEGCVFATNLALELRQKFHCDVFIDLICYRKYGHNESDEPAFTQPLEYQIIRQKKPIREMYRDHLISQGVLEREMAKALEEEFRASLQKALSGTEDPVKQGEHEHPRKEISENKTDDIKYRETFITSERLIEIGDAVSYIPQGLTIHTKLQRVIAERKEMAQGKRAVDWGMGETIAYASILLEGKHVRISGQDSGRGTFSHRHALWMDQVQGKAYYPLKNLKRGQGRFDVFNSLLSEYAVLGFEYGYSIVYPEALVIWEAQFGDFCNSAQVIIDQFISTSEMKWMQKAGVVLLLPHGYEGQGPEHSSARMERFLALAGNQNMQVVNPTEPVQLFHLLRRQVLTPVLKPLIIFTPKGLLRHPECVNQIGDFTKGRFQEILDDPCNASVCETLVFCSGKIYYDLTSEIKKRELEGMAIVRIEQLYPLNIDRVSSIIEKYKGFTRCLWMQEEPQNMGAWDFIRPKIEGLLPSDATLEYIGRRRSASPAVGSFALHKKEHAEMMDNLFGKE